MDAIKQNSFDTLAQILEELVLLYRNLFDLLVKEKAYLIAADIDQLLESNRTKEALLHKIKGVDRKREFAAKALGKSIGLDQAVPRLLELAQKINDKPKSELLTQMHQTLTLQIERTLELNRENDIYTQSALRVLNGAIDDIKQAAVGPKKNTYGKSGQTKQNSEAQSGNFVSKEA